MWRNSLGGLTLAPTRSNGHRDDGDKRDKHNAQAAQGCSLDTPGAGRPWESQLRPENTAGSAIAVRKPCNSLPTKLQSA